MIKNVKASDTSQNNPTSSAPAENIKAMDWIALLHYDRQTGTLDLGSKKIIKDAGTVRRLVDNRLIFSDGKLTSAGWRMCAALSRKLKNLKKGNRTHPAKNSGGEKDKATATSSKIRASDWSILMTYDRATGNLFGIDPHTRLPDRRTKAILKNNGAIKRLMDKGLILPGGWLTPGAKKKCKQLEKLIRRRRPDRPSYPLKKNTGNSLSQAEFFSKVFKNMDRPSLLSKYDSAPNRFQGRPPSGAGQFSMRDLLNLIFKRKAYILIFFGVIFIGTFTYSFTVDPAYEATAQILVKLGRESIFLPATGNIGPVINFDREERINSEIEILKSRPLAERVVETLGPTVIYRRLKDGKNGILDYLLPGAAADVSPGEKTALRFERAVAALKDTIEVVGIRKSNVIQVGFRHEDPKMAATVVNTLADAYLDHHLAVHKTPQNVDFFKEQSALLSDKLGRSEKKLKSLKEQHRVSSLEEERTLLLSEEAALRAELNRTLSEEVQTEKRIRQLEQQLAVTPKTIPQEEESDQNPYLINTLEARLVELELEEKDLLAKYTDTSRLVRNVKDEIKIVRQKLTEQEKKRYGRKRSGLNTTYQRLQETLFQNEAELKAIKAKAKIQLTQLDEYLRKLENLNQIEVELNQLEQLVGVDRQNYRLYLTKYEESRISDAMDTEKIASVSLIQPAHQPLKPVSPKVILNMLGAILLGTFGGLTLAFIVEYLDDKLEKIEDIEETLQLPVLASIPEFDNGKYDDKRSAFYFIDQGYRTTVKEVARIKDTILSRWSKISTKRHVLKSWCRSNLSFGSSKARDEHL